MYLWGVDVHAITVPGIYVLGERNSMSWPECSCGKSWPLGHGTPFAGSSWRSGNSILLCGQLAVGVVLGNPRSGYAVFHGMRACRVQLLLIVD